MYIPVSSLALWQGFDAFDGEMIARHYRIPAAVYDGDGLHSYSTSDELAAKFTNNCEAFKGVGYHGAEFSVGHYMQNGENAATVDLGWRVQLGESTRDFRTTYVCVRVDGQWGIMSAVAYEGLYEEIARCMNA